MTVLFKTSHNIRVQVESKYQDDMSQPEQAKFVFSYHVVINNDGDEAIQIYKSEFTLTDAFLNAEIIEQEGVANEKATIMPGHSFSYTSHCHIKTSFGSMKGFYYAVNDAGKNIKIEVPEFTLAHPFAIQ